MAVPLVDHQDFIWARVPVLAPMAETIARRREVAREVATRIKALGQMLLDHLDAEQRMLASDGAAAAASWVGTGMLGDHMTIATALDELIAVVARWDGPATVLERRFGDELAVLAEHIYAQIALEEAEVTARLAG